MECLLVEKSKFTKLDEAAAKLYKDLEECWWEAEEHFLNKNEVGVYLAMEKFIQLGSAAFDVDIIKKGNHLLSNVAEHFKDFPTAIKYYKWLWDACEEDSDYTMKLNAYYSMGKAYQ